MCKNCQNSRNTNEEIPSKWYYSAKRNIEYRECLRCSQILEEKEHVHMPSIEWDYNKENQLDIKKCSICGVILETRPHIVGFKEESNAFENWCSNEYKETNVDTMEKYLAGEEAYLYYENQLLSDSLEEEDYTLTRELNKMFKAS